MGTKGATPLLSSQLWTVAEQLCELQFCSQGEGGSSRTCPEPGGSEKLPVAAPGEVGSEWDTAS